MRGVNLEGRLADQALVDDRPDAPQVGLGVVILGHDDLRSLRGAERVVQSCLVRELLMEATFFIGLYCNTKTRVGRGGGGVGVGRRHILTMYMGDPHNVAAIMLLWRYRAKPKSAGKERSSELEHRLLFCNNTICYC